MSEFFSVSSKFFIFTKMAISFLFAKFACANVAAKFFDVNLLIWLNYLLIKLILMLTY